MPTIRNVYLQPSDGSQDLGFRYVTLLSASNSRFSDRVVVVPICLMKRFWVQRHGVFRKAILRWVLDLAL